MSEPKGKGKAPAELTDDDPASTGSATDPYKIKAKHFKSFTDVEDMKIAIKKVLRRYDAIRPDMHESCKRELHQFLSDPDWLKMIGGKGPSQSRFYKQLTGNGRSHASLHFGKWLVMSALFEGNQALKGKVADSLSKWWGEPFPGTDVFYPKNTPDGAAQLLKFRGEAGAGSKNTTSKSTQDKPKEAKDVAKGDGYSDESTDEEEPASKKTLPAGPYIQNKGAENKQRREKRYHPGEYPSGSKPSGKQRYNAVAGPSGLRHELQVSTTPKDSSTKLNFGNTVKPSSIADLFRNTLKRKQQSSPGDSTPRDGHSSSGDKRLRIDADDAFSDGNVNDDEMMSLTQDEGNSAPLGEVNVLRDALGVAIRNLRKNQAAKEQPVSVEQSNASNASANITTSHTTHQEDISEFPQPGVAEPEVISSDSDSDIDFDGQDFTREAEIERVVRERGEVHSVRDRAEVYSVRPARITKTQEESERHSSLIFNQLHELQKHVQRNSRDIHELSQKMEDGERQSHRSSVRKSLYASGNATQNADGTGNVASEGKESEATIARLETTLSKIIKTQETEAKKSSANIARLEATISEIIKIQEIEAKKSLATIARHEATIARLEANGLRYLYD
ncbi:hypothetical protein F66182_8583 [Fusarium sp. NRRL 66182]|nr:hypothetical protein F66182_8583 [Fusarium sp. NRRL 66182]